MSTSGGVGAQSATQGLQHRWEQHLMATYATPGVAFVRGEGTALFDADGAAYLDLLSGLAVTSLGHAHPAVTRAIAEQAATLVHTSNLFITQPPVALAQRLADVSGWPDARVFLANSGAEANEAAIKLARRHGLATDPGKTRLVALEGSFHGRTLATLEATGQVSKHAPFAPLAGFVDHVPHDDPDALAAAVDDRTSGVLVEVIQGEGGVRRVPDDVLLAAREACDRHDALLIVDEVQTGVGRSGEWFAWQGSPIVPDVMTLAKALANGLPIGACVARGPAAETFAAGDHASTFGGNPVSCAAALAVLETIEREGLVERAAAVGGRLRGGLEQLAESSPIASGVRGRGLLLALELAQPVAADLQAACLDRYLVTNAVGPDLLRLAPPLTIADDEVDLALAGLEDALTALEETLAGSGPTEVGA